MKSHQLHLNTTSGGSRGRTGRSSATGGVQLAAASTTGGFRTESWSYEILQTAEKQKVFRAHVAPQGVCDNLINAIKLLANQHQDGDGPVKVLVWGFQKRSQPKMMEELRKFITMDNQEAVKIGDLEKRQALRPVVKPKVQYRCP